MPTPRRRRQRRFTPHVPPVAPANVLMGPDISLHAGMPALDAVHSTATIRSPGTAGRTYTVLRTTEVDSYELEAAAKKGLPAPGPLAPIPTGDSFKGTARKAAKLSIAKAPVEAFKDLRTLVKSLALDATMASLKPPITTTATSDRVSQEKRNIRVKAFLYAASRESDNDFHLIVGADPKTSPEVYMTMELSGLPPKSAKAHAKLKAARDAYSTFFGGNLPGLTYDFYQPPIPIQVEGSLFFDVTHATGQRPGPPSLKSRMPTIWEVHPISSIVLEP